MRLYVTECVHVSLCLFVFMCCCVYVCLSPYALECVRAVCLCVCAFA